MGGTLTCGMQNQSLQLVLILFMSCGYTCLGIALDLTCCSQNYDELSSNCRSPTSEYCPAQASADLAVRRKAHGCHYAFFLKTWHPGWVEMNFLANIITSVTHDCQCRIINEEYQSQHCGSLIIVFIHVHSLVILAIIDIVIDHHEPTIVISAWWFPTVSICSK